MQYGVTLLWLQKMKNQEEFEEFIKETQMLFKLKHPHLIQFLGIYIDLNGETYIITDYMNQGSLLDVLKREDNIPTKKLLQMCIEACMALVYLEKEKIIHRDVAARNFLISKIGNVGDYVLKLGDFGMSRSTQNEIYKKKEGKFPIRWSAPEILNHGTYSSKSDVWAFGIFIWELYNHGKLPYGELSNQEIYYAVPKGLRLSRPESCPMDIWRIVFSCWADDPSNRPSFSEIIKSLKMINPGESQIISNDDSPETIELVYLQT